MIDEDASKGRLNSAVRFTSHLHVMICPLVECEECADSLHRSVVACCTLKF